MTKQQRARLLVFNEPHAMRIDSRLAKEIGFEDSVVFLQLEYLIGISQHEHEGRLWTFQSLRTLNKEQFPWWSPAKLMRIIKRLEERELIIIGNFNKTEWDKTQWFALNEVGVSRLKSVYLAADPFQNETPPVSKRNIDVSKMKHRLDQDETTIPETTTETTQRGGDTRAKDAAAAAISQTEKELMAAGGLNLKQARTAVKQQEITPEIIGRIKVWADKIRAAGKSPGAILCGYTDAGLLPDDLPAAKRPTDDFRVYRPDGSIDTDATNRRLRDNPGLMLARA